MRKFYLEADIKLEKETEDLKRAVAAVIDLPNREDKQPDLLYFSALFVSAGTNLNDAHFLPSELVKAEDTVVSKALDVEHKEEEIIGHIYDRVFIDASGTTLDLNELASKEDASLDKENTDIHIVVAGVVYKNRFPNMAKEISDGDWRVSMECYFGSYDIKIGDTIMTRREAEVMGLAQDSFFGKMAKVLKNGKEIAKGKVVRVLRGIVFSGCGVVKNPAEPNAVVLETANEKLQDKLDPKDVIVLDYDKLEQAEVNNNVTSDNIESDVSVITDINEEDADLVYDDTVGVCVSYKRRIFAGEPKGPDTEVTHEDWCTLYDKECASFSRDTTDPKCLRNQVKKTVHTYAKKLIKTREESNKRDELVEDLNRILENAYRLKSD